MKKLLVIVGAALVGVIGLGAIAMSQSGDRVMTPPTPERPVVACGGEGLSYPFERNAGGGLVPISQDECDAWAKENGVWSVGQ